MGSHAWVFSLFVLLQRSSTTSLYRARSNQMYVIMFQCENSSEVYKYTMLYSSRDFCSNINLCLNKCN